MIDALNRDLGHGSLQELFQKTEGTTNQLIDGSLEFAEAKTSKKYTSLRGYGWRKKTGKIAAAGLTCHDHLHSIRQH